MYKKYFSKKGIINKKISYLEVHKQHTVELAKLLGKYYNDLASEFSNLSQKNILGGIVKGLFYVCETSTKYLTSKGE